MIRSQRMVQRTFVQAFMIFVGATIVLATPAAATKFAGAFMDVGGGARALGMGGTYAAIAADASTVYWNPAGISELGHRQALAMHAERFGDLVKYNFAAYSQPTTLLGPEREAAFGFALLHLGVDDNIVTNQLGHFDPNGNGLIDPGEYLTDANGQRFDAYESLPRESDNSFALLNTFAMKTEYGRVGGTLKLIYNDAIAGESSVGIGIDLGWLHRDFLVQHLSMGVKLQDATGTYISWSTGTNEFITPMVKVGSAYEIVSEQFNGSLILAADADVFFENRQTASQFWMGSMSTDLHVGAELNFQNRVMVRGGLDAENPTAGAGFRVGILGFDYAYLHHDDFDATHRVSALVDF